MKEIRRNHDITNEEEEIKMEKGWVVEYAEYFENIDNVIGVYDSKEAAIDAAKFHASMGDRVQVAKYSEWDTGNYNPIEF